MEHTSHATQPMFSVGHSILSFETWDKVADVTSETQHPFSFEKRKLTKNEMFII